MTNMTVPVERAASQKIAGISLNRIVFVTISATNNVYTTAMTEASALGRRLEPKPRSEQFRRCYAKMSQKTQERLGRAPMSEMPETTP